MLPTVWRALEVADVVALDRAGGPASPSASASSWSAPGLTLVREPAGLLTRERLLALRVASSISSRFSPRWACAGGPRCLAARQERLEVSCVSITDRGTRISGGTLVARA